MSGMNLIISLSKKTFYLFPLCMDFSPLKKIDELDMADDEVLLDIVRMLDDSGKKAGFFYVVITP